MSSWCERLAKLDLKKVRSSDVVLERTFVCGPHFVGKSRILQQITDQDHECNVCSTNYKSLMYENGQSVPTIYILRRMDNKIYEHTLLQLKINTLINETINAVAAADEDDRESQFDQRVWSFVQKCQTIRPEHLNINRNLVILIDVTKSFIDRYTPYIPFLYLQVIGYVSLLKRFYRFARFVIAYDRESLDPRLSRFQVYETLEKYSTPIPINRNVRLVRPEEFDATARQDLIGMHKTEPLNIEQFM